MVHAEDLVELLNSCRADLGQRKSVRAGRQRPVGCFAKPTILAWLLSYRPWRPSHRIAKKQYYPTFQGSSERGAQQEFEAGNPLDMDYSGDLGPVSFIESTPFL